MGATVAEMLLLTADSLYRCPGLVVADHSIGPCQLDRINIAVKFSRLAPYLQLRAIVEEWDIDQCKNWIY